MEIAEIIRKHIDKLRNQLDKSELAQGEIIFNNGGCQILSQSSVIYELIVSSEITDAATGYALNIEENGNIFPSVEKEICEWDKYSFACL